MISVLVGFFTIFIGVFMVNDAKAANTSLIEKTSQARHSYSLENGYKPGQRGEFVPLQELDDHDADNM
jgi:hypothetical protein